MSPEHTLSLSQAGHVEVMVQDFNLYVVAVKPRCLTIRRWIDVITL